MFMDVCFVSSTGLDIPSGNLTQLLKLAMSNGKIHYK